MAIGVIAQAVPVKTRNGWKAPISIGKSQLALALIIFAPVSSKVFKKLPNGPMIIIAIGAEINKIISGFKKNFMIDGVYFSAIFST